MQLPLSPATARIIAPLRSILIDLEFWLVIGLWIVHFTVLAAPFPLNYDSVNLARAIEDKIDITIHQPQPPGFLFQVLLGRYIHLLVTDPFTVLELQSLLYLVIMLLFMRAAPSRRFGDLLLCGTTPLFLFFTGAPVMQSASVAFGAGSAFLIVRAIEQGRGNPILMAILISVGAGFRYDLLIFLGPVTLLGMAVSRPSIRQWLIAALCFTVITLAWYIPVSALSGWASPYGLTKEMQQNFTSGISFISGGSLFENVRCALRFLLYFPGVFGPGGLLICILLIAGRRTSYTNVALAATIPFFLAGVILYMPLPQYYAPVAGFCIALPLFIGKLPRNRSITILCITANLLFFWFMPQPIQPAGRFHDRAPAASVRKQLSFIGSNSAAVLLYNKELMRLADSTCGRCERFYTPLLWGRMWIYLAEKRWHNRFTNSQDSADCIMMPIEQAAARSAPGRIFCRDVIIRRIGPCQQK